MDLYRYITFESFVDIVQSKELTLVSPVHSWKDKYEGILFRAIRTEKGRQEFKRIIKDNNLSDLSPILEDEMFSKFIKCQCWSKERDSVAMWSIYSYGDKSIMIKTTKEKLESLKFEEQSLKTVPVKYIEEINLESEIFQAIKGNSLSMSAVFSTKRSEFAHENEIRVFVGGVNDFNNTETYSDPIRVGIDQSMSNFIEEVLVHPSAPNWYIKVVEKFCKDRNINFLGRSKLYEFDLM